MKNNYSAYKPFLTFLGKFFIAYFILFFLYQFYLNSFNSSKHEVDGFTKWVAEVSTRLLTSLGYNAHIVSNEKAPYYNFYLNDTAVSRIVEGCNGLSVIILFATFIYAFSNKLKPTILYILAGTSLICILNIVRIALLNVLLYYYSEYRVLLHDVFFPLIIYGTVFILWLIWVNKFSKYARK